VAVIGYLSKKPEEPNEKNGIQFIVSREVFRTPKNMKWGGSARYSTHARHATHALTEFTGLDPDSFTFDILLTAELGVNPMDEIIKIWDYERNAEALGLTIGGHGYGKYRWNITKHETRMEYTDVMGDLYAVEVSLTLQEYLNSESGRAAAPVETAPAAGSGGAADGPGGTYTVKKGDNLWTLAKKFYGNGADYSKIYEANKETIGGNPGLIYPGQTFTIPSQEA